KELLRGGPHDRAFAMNVDDGAAGALDGFNHRRPARFAGMGQPPSQQPNSKNQDQSSKNQIPSESAFRLLGFGSWILVLGSRCLVFLPWVQAHGVPSQQVGVRDLPG